MKRFRLPLLSCNGDTQAIRKAIVAGFFANAATIAPDGSYISLRGSCCILFLFFSLYLWSFFLPSFSDNLPLHLHPTSVAFKHAPEWVVFHEVLQTTKMYMRDISAIDPTVRAIIVFLFFIFYFLFFIFYFFFYFFLFIFFLVSYLSSPLLVALGPRSSFLQRISPKSQEIFLFFFRVLFFLFFLFLFLFLLFLFLFLFSISSIIYFVPKVKQNKRKR